VNLEEECLLMYEAAEKAGKIQIIKAAREDGHILYSEYGEVKVKGEHITIYYFRMKPLFEDQNGKLEEKQKTNSSAHNCLTLIVDEEDKVVRIGPTIDKLMKVKSYGTGSYLLEKIIALAKKRYKEYGFIGVKNISTVDEVDPDNKARRDALYKNFNIICATKVSELNQHAHREIIFKEVNLSQLLYDHRDEVQDLKYKLSQKEDWIESSKQDMRDIKRFRKYLIILVFVLIFVITLAEF